MAERGWQQVCRMKQVGGDRKKNKKKTNTLFLFFVFFAIAGRP